MNPTQAKEQASRSAPRSAEGPQTAGHAWAAQHARTSVAYQHQGGATGTSPFFKGLALPEDDQPAVTVLSRHVKAKEVIFFKGDPATHLYLVVRGKVKVSAPSVDGKEITFAILDAGEFIGEMGVLEGAEHTATVTALEQTELAVLDRKDFLPLLQQCPAFGIKVLTVLCQRLRQASEMAEDLTFLTLPVRLAKKLCALANAYGVATAEGLQIGLHLCQQELANLVGTSRESINKQLAIWQTEGLVSMEHGILTICRLPDLLAKAAPPTGQVGGRRAVG